MAYCGIDIGGTNIKIRLFDRDLSEVGFIPVSNDSSQAPEKILSLITDKLCEAKNKFSFQAIGVGCAGLVDSTEGVVITSPNLPSWNNVRIGDYLKNQFGVPVGILNDVNALAYAEYSRRKEGERGNVLLITLGTGIGGGLILEGDIFTGDHEFAGEVGHMTLFPDGIPCNCGNRGCVEQYAAAAGIVRRAREAGIDISSPEELYSEAENGLTAAGKVFRETGRYLGVILADIIHLLDMELILLGGKISRAEKYFLPALRDEVKNRVYPRQADSITIEICRDAEPALGAVLWTRDRFNI